MGQKNCPHPVTNLVKRIHKAFAIRYRYIIIYVIEESGTKAFLLNLVTIDLIGAPFFSFQEEDSMAAFEKIKSGITSMDLVLDHIRLGDNVVIQVTSLADFGRIVEPFVTRAIEDGRNMIYIRFSNHEPFFLPRNGLKIYELDASEGFESFTVALHEIITKEGLEAFYVFDSLSELQVRWSTDLMMGNFFCVTCPYLFELDTVAFFPVMRGHHDFATIARIQETTQLLLDIYSDDRNAYLHPIKVWNRYHPEMFLPYRINGDNELESLENSVDLAQYYRLRHKEQQDHSEQNLDSYERFFRGVKEAYSRNELEDKALQKLCKSMMTHDHRMSAMLLKEFAPEDFFFVKDRMIGTGTIGGKACGMLLARKMVENHLPQYAGYIEPQDSFYIATDVFYSYIVENKLWKLRIMQRSEEHYFDKAKELAQAILVGHFSESIRAQFRRMLEYFGQFPIIVRSSSFLEDGFGNAFAGKYESVFCVNACSPEERLLQFENAVRRVYASTMDQSALEYRKKRGLAGSDEQMAILVQRVSGTKFGSYYMPCAAGVGFSYSVYRWSNELSEEAGLLRLVAGLGTKSVDRTGTDYPRLVNLDKAEATTLSSTEEKHRYSQRNLDVISLNRNEMTEIPAIKLMTELPDWYIDLIYEHDYDMERVFEERGQKRQIRFVSCQGIVKKNYLMKMMKDILAMLQEQYGNPVDIEYTMNFRQDGEFTVNLLQCRPLYVWQKAFHRKLPQISRERTLFRVNRTFMGNNDMLPIDIVVMVDAERYHHYPYNKKSSLCRIIADINQYYKDSKKTLMLISPGRIGTSSPELGLPVTFSDISGFKLICEYADRKIGFVPELSYGSHMFQDIVETEMFYVAIMDSLQDDAELFQKNLLERETSILSQIHQDLDAAEIIKVYQTSEKALKLYADFEEKVVVCGFELG